MISNLVEEFLEDARTQIEQFEQALLWLDEHENDEDALARLYRATHSLKGSSYYVGFQHLGEIFHRLEDVLQPLVKAKQSLDADKKETLFHLLDFIKHALDVIANGGEDIEISEDITLALEVLSGEAEMVTQKEDGAEEPGESKGLEVISADEYDPELFQIFLETLTERLERLFSLLEEYSFQGDDIPSSELNEVFYRLISTSRYMDHKPLVQLFTDWRDETDKAISHGESLGFLCSVFDRYLEQLRPKVPSFDASPLKGILNKVRNKHGEIGGVEQGEEEEDKREEEDISEALSILDKHIEEVFRAWSDEVKEEEVTYEAPKIPESPFIVEEEAVVTPDREEEVVAPQLLKVDPVKVDQLLNRVGELVIRRSEFDTLVHELGGFIEQWSRMGHIRPEEGRVLSALQDRFQDSLTLLGRLTTELQDAVMGIRMLPLIQLFNRFPRAVRDHAKQLGKEVRLIIHGGETELDRYILEQLYEPMLHILRNAVVHGIELPEEREQYGKPPRGTISIRAYYRNQMVYIEVSDDGRGIDLNRLRNMLIEEGYFSRGDVEKMTGQALLETVFLPGISTALSADESAGRGMGLEIVRTRCRSLNGHVFVQSRQGIGTKFIIEIPLTLAIIPALLVRIGEITYTFPLSSVVEVYKYRKEKAKRIKESYVYALEDKTIPLVFPRQVFPRLFKENGNGEGNYVVLIRTPSQEVGFVVDEFLGHQEVVIKPIEDTLSAIRGYAGATILGDGSISLILDVSDLLENTFVSRSVAF